MFKVYSKINYASDLSERDLAYLKVAYDYLFDLYIKFLKGEISASAYLGRVQCFYDKIYAIVSKYINFS